MARVMVARPRELSRPRERSRPRELFRSQLTSLRVQLNLADGLSAAAVVLMTVIACDVLGEPFEGWARLGIWCWPMAALFGLGWVAALWSQGLYDLGLRWTLRSELGIIAKATFLMAGLVLSGLFLAQQSESSRLSLLFIFTAVPLVTGVHRAVVRQVYRGAVAHGLNERYMVIVGTDAEADAFADRIEERRLGIRVIGHVNPGPPGSSCVQRPILGSLEQFEKVLHRYAVDDIVVCTASVSPEWQQKIVYLSAEEGKALHQVFGQRRQRWTNDQEFGGFVVRSAIDGAGHELGLIVKRVIDIVGAAAALVLLSPVLVAVAVFIRYRSGWPVLFRQTRVGLQGRLFTIVKFRTMVPDAEALYSSVATRSDTRGAAFKMIDDPRVTSWGRFLRKTSLDELPQFVNVFIGDMSLVGPRPAPPREVDAYDIWHRRRLSMKPGITGLWQVRSRLDEQFDDRARLDLEYIDGWSIWRDISIMARTVVVIFTKPGT